MGSAFVLQNFDLKFFEQSVWGWVKPLSSGVCNREAWRSCLPMLIGNECFSDYQMPDGLEKLVLEESSKSYPYRLQLFVSVL